MNDTKRLNEIMLSYIGTKLINATPFTRGQYNNLRGWRSPEGEDHTTDGYLVEYTDGSMGINHQDFTGYISWSTKEVFEQSYHITNGISFGLAIEALKCGKKVARGGWNGKGIFIELQLPEEGSKMTSPYIYINTTGLQTDNPLAPKSLVPWLASQTDMLAEDWAIV